MPGPNDRDEDYWTRLQAVIQRFPQRTPMQLTDILISDAASDGRFQEALRDALAGLLL